MNTRIGLCLAAAFGLGVVGLPAAPAHGFDHPVVPFTATGKATLAFGLVEVLDATLSFDGTSWSVELREPTTQVPVHQNSFTGTLALDPPHVLNQCLEHNVFKGVSDPLPKQAVLEVDGLQEHNACAGTIRYDVNGMYLAFFLILHG